MKSSSTFRPRKPNFKSCEKALEHASQAEAVDICVAEGLGHRLNKNEFNFEALCFRGFTGRKKRLPGYNPLRDIENLHSITRGDRNIRHAAPTNLSAVCLAALVHRNSASGFDSSRTTKSP
jgi:hypothetical protein